MDYFILDMKDKKITLYDKNINDSFLFSINNIKKIDVLKDESKKIIIIICEHGNVSIKLDEKTSRQLHTAYGRERTIAN